MRCTRFWLWISCSLACVTTSTAGDKYAGEFLGLGVGGRSLGMGGAYVAVSRDVTAGYWNPAGLAYLMYPEAMVMHTSQFSGILNYDYASFGMPVGRQNSLGLSILRIGVDDIKETALRNPDIALGEFYLDESGQLVRNTPYVQDSFGSTDYAFLLTYSKGITEGFAYGGNVKFLTRSLGDHSAWGVGFDFGVVYNPWSKWVVGVNLQDITTTLLAWDTGKKEHIRPSVRAGVTYPIALGFLTGRMQPALDFVFRFENRQVAALANIGSASVDVNIGWEYLYQDVFAVRVGSPEVGPLTAGVGLHFPKLHIDYAFLSHDDLGSTHRISARLTFKEPRFMRKK